MNTHTIRADMGAVRDAATVVPAMTLAEYRRRTANATRPYTDPPIGSRRRPGATPTWGDVA